MSDSVFVDTNVFVYARDGSERVKQPAAAEWVRRLWIDQQGRTSIQVLNEYYVTVTRKLDPGLARQDAWDDVQALFSWAPQEVTPDLLVRAREVEGRYGLSWWDSMIVASAQMQSCPLLLSEDLQDGMMCDGVTVLNPFSRSVSEQHASYGVLPEPLSRHRSPGRPRREQSTFR